MSVYLGILVGLGVAVPMARATTEVAGSITTDTTWTAAGSPYVLTDGVTVANGATLTIDPGVRVESTTSRLNVAGRLLAVGTPADPITFSLHDGLAFYAGSEGSMVAWATVRDSSGFGITTRQDSSFRYGPWPDVHDVEFRANRWGIYPWYPSQGAVAIRDVRFYGNTYGIAGVGGDFTLEDVAVVGSLLATATLSNNPGQSWTVSRSNLVPPVSGSACSSGQSGCTLHVYLGTYAFDDVWWGTPSLSQIAPRVFDGNDDPSRSAATFGTVAQAPHDLYPPTSAPSLANGSRIAPTVAELTGTASDSPEAPGVVAAVDVSLLDISAGRSWNGAEWVAGEVFRRAVGRVSWSIPVPPLADGRTYLVRSLARDEAGNVQFGATSRSFVTDGLAPQTFLNGAPAPEMERGVVTLHFGADEPASFECRIDGSAWSTCTSPWSGLVAEDGSHAFEVRATDQAGNVDASPARHEFTVLAPAAPPVVLAVPDAIVPPVGGSDAPPSGPSPTPPVDRRSPILRAGSVRVRRLGILWRALRVRSDEVATLSVSGYAVIGGKRYALRPDRRTLRRNVAVTLFPQLAKRPRPIKGQPARRPRNVTLQIRVTDRAGNVTRRTLRLILTV